MIQKSHLIQVCLQTIAEKRGSLETQVRSIMDSQGSDTKSSAGDKHETSREMAAQELGKLDASLANLKQMEQDLERIDVDRVHETIGFGSLVETENNIFFLSAALGKVKCDEVDVMLISTVAPLAIAFKGQVKDALISFNGMEHRITSVH